ncbi:hypothetical protein [Inquilinus sp. CAU 1745]|uniref:hypothetical protein n=1 Tax=Inquilinus sp. CAU 1745 TaxID=3140369 RepID=UPI00325A96DC
MVGRVAAAAVGIVALWAVISLALNLPRWPTELFGPLHLALAVEVGIAFALVALLPGRRPLRITLAILLTALVALRLMDLTAQSVVARPLNLFLDVTLVPALYTVLRTTVGAAESVALLLGAALGLVACFWLIALALRVVERLARRRDGRIALGIVLPAGLLLFLLGATFQTPWRPVVASAGGAVAFQVDQMARTLDRHAAFRAAADQDAFAGLDGETLAAGLREADVFVIFVESYGVTALDDSQFAPVMAARLAAFEDKLAAAGLSGVSGRLDSPTVGGQSWLAHSTLLSGLRIADQTLYSLLLTGDRRTLTDLMGRAGYRTVGLMPAITLPWPEGEMMGFDAIHDAHDMNYEGPLWYWGTIPDQYALAFLERQELSETGRPPIFTVAALIGSHAPWTPVPEVIEDWSLIGDGRIFHRFVDNGEPPEIVWRDPGSIRAYYARSVGASIDILASWAARHLDQGDLAIILGDHQPAPVVTGPGAPPDVPIHIVSGDPSLLAPFRGWGFVPGMVPGPGVAARPMEDFRDFFLRAFTVPRPEMAGGERTGS